MHTIDWEAAVAVAEQLGARTRMLVASKDADAAREWAIRMASDNSGTERRSLTYLELAVMLGHGRDEVREQARLDWNSLLAEVVRLKAAVGAKADAELKAEKAKLEPVRAEEPPAA